MVAMHLSVRGSGVPSVLNEPEGSRTTDLCRHMDFSGGWFLYSSFPMADKLRDLLQKRLRQEGSFMEIVLGLK